MKRKKKILSIQIIIFFISITLLFFTYYGKNSSSFKAENKSPIKIETKNQNKKSKTNNFENIEYKGIDFNGNIMQMTLLA